MRVIEVGPEDPRAADYRNLTDVGWRQQLEPAEGLFLAEGEKVIRRALTAGFEPRSALMTRRWLPGLTDVLESWDVDVMVADEATLKAVVGFRLHRGALAAFGRRAAAPVAQVLDGASRIVVLENLVDHTNVGLVFRTAAALGMDAIVVSPACADPYYRRAVKTSMGAVLELPWTTAEAWPSTLTGMVEDGWQVAALTPAPEAVDIRRWRPGVGTRVALALGSEGPGLTSAALASVSVRLRIPVTARVDSLNVAAAAAIACYELGKPTSDGGGHDRS
ncbi:MAG: methyltransferase [Actinomycetota bacterium]|nr:methyltransferase [Actinomycetota bacterium]